MTEYVLDPPEAHGIVKDAETLAEEGAEFASQLSGAIDRLESAFNESFVGVDIVSFCRKARSNTLVALARIDNATGAGHRVINLLEAADVQMADEADAAAQELTSQAEVFAGKGMSRP